MQDYKYHKVTFDVGGPGVCLVEFSRPPANAFNPGMWQELGRLFEDLSDDSNVRVVVLSSSSPKFWTAGLDLLDTGSVTRPPGSDPARKGLIMQPHIKLFQDAISALERCTKPVIGAAHGIALGLGIDILCACDVRYSATDVTFSIKEVDVGMAADIGTLARLPKIAGNQSAVRELALTARNFGAEEAKDVGFVSKVVKGGRNEVQAAALETAKLIASKSPVAVVGTKHLILHARDHTVQDNLNYTATWNALTLQSADAVDAFSAFQKKQVPVFKNLQSKL